MIRLPCRRGVQSVRGLPSLTGGPGAIRASIGPRGAQEIPNAIKRLIGRGVGAAGYEIRRKVDRPARAPANTPRPDPLALAVVGCLRSQRVDCVLDVGAHRGEFGDSIRAAGWKGPIISFEPVSSSFEELRAHAAGDPDWSVVRLALGRHRGTATIGVMAGSNLSSFLDPNGLALERWPELAQKTRTETVEVDRLDDVLNAGATTTGYGRLFLKLDTQGFDLEVFAGAGASLDRIFGLLVEVSFQPVYEGIPHYLDALAEFERSGFATVDFFPISRDGHGRLIEADCLMARADRPTVVGPERESGPDS